MLNKLLKNNGFTFIELLVYITIFLLFITMSTNYVISGFKLERFESEQNEALIEARRAINIITKDIRGAKSSEQGDYVLSTIADDNLVFYSDVDNDGQTEKISYILNNSILTRSVTEPGSLNDYSDSPSSEAIARYVNNQEESVFIYYNEDYNETPTINDIRLIKIVLKINVTPEISPNDYYIESEVQMRNLKDN